MKTKLSYKSISEIGVQEKYIRKNHYNTIKTWWARRPITTSRALLINEILIRNNATNDLVDLVLLEDINPSNSVVSNFKTKYNTHDISVLDVFSGGGSIPFESQRLGFDTYSSELNPVAILLQETIFNSLLIKNYSNKLKIHGTKIIERLESKLSKYFQIDKVKPYVIFWSKVASCKNCGADLDLRRIEYLCKKNHKTVRIQSILSELKIISNEKTENKSSKDFICDSCETLHTFKDLKKFCQDNSFKHKPFAYCYAAQGKKYKIISPSEKEILDKYENDIDLEIENLKWLIPDEAVKAKSGVINPTIYELKKHRDFFSKRQLLILLSLIKEIIDEYASLKLHCEDNESKQIVNGLTSLIEFLCDWNSVSTMWIPQNEQTGRSLAGPGVGMKWDFIEINPFYSSGSNLRSKLERVCSTFSALGTVNPVKIHSGTSTCLPIKDQSIDIVLTDPPYYDSIDYTGLSEFFRPWFEMLIKNTYDKDINLKNNDRLEAIVELSSQSTKGHDHYKDIMTDVLNEIHRVMKSNGSCMLMYSHKTIEGWQVIADAFKNANLFVDECLPLEMERIARPRAMSYEALNGVIVFRAKKDQEQIKTTYSDVAQIKDRIVNGDMLESQVVIYLAGLACKEVTLSSKTFKEAYAYVTQMYQIANLENWIKGDLDDVTIAYLEGKLLGSLSNLDSRYREILIENGLVNGDKVTGLEFVSSVYFNRDTVLGKCSDIFDDFVYNSKTKVFIDKKAFNSVNTFFSILAGTQLTTVNKRTNNLEIKTSRMILSKLSLSDKLPFTYQPLLL